MTKPSCDFCWVREQFVSLVRLQPACGPHCLDTTHD